MERDIFDYPAYKPYLNDWVRSRPRQGHGMRSKIANAIRCQVAYVSQILNGDAQLSVEQADALSRFIGHAKDEAHFFLLLVQRERAGTASLRDYFSEQIELVLQRRLNLKERAGVKQTLALEDQATYYSAWYYAAVHVAVSIESLQTKEALVARMQLPLAKISQVLEFLVSTGLVIQENGKYRTGTARLHLGSDSPLVNRQHSLWRMRALAAMDKSGDDDLFYSSVVTMSVADVRRLKTKLVKWITEAKDLIRESKEEDIQCFSVDFFRLRE